MEWLSSIYMRGIHNFTIRGLLGTEYTLQTKSERGQTRAHHLHSKGQEHHLKKMSFLPPLPHTEPRCTTKRFPRMRAQYFRAARTGGGWRERKERTTLHQQPGGLWQWTREGASTHRRIWHTAGEGHSTFLSAVAGTTAVEVDIEVPVFRAIGPTALILKSQKPRTA